MAMSETNFDNQLRAIADLFKEGLINYGSQTSGDNVVALINTIKGIAGGRRQGDVTNEGLQYKDQFANLHKDRLSGMLTPLFLDYAHFIDAKVKSSVQGAWPYIFRHFVTNSKSVKTRDISFDSSATESGTGDHSIFRLARNEINNEINENVYAPLDTTIQIAQDESDGLRKFEEIFRFSAPIAESLVEQSGFGIGEPSPDLKARNSDGSFLTNHSWQLGQSGGVAIADPVAANFGDWSDPTGVYGSAKYAFNSANTYRRSFEESQGSNIAVSLEIKGNHTLQQSLTGLKRGAAYFWPMRVMRLDSCDATTTLQVGSNATATLDLSTISNNTWTLITPTLDYNLYKSRFVQTDLKAQLITTDLTTGTYLVDAMDFGEMVYWNGCRWYMVAGQTPALNTEGSPKTYLYEDTLAGSDAMINLMLLMVFGLFLRGQASPSIAAV